MIDGNINDNDIANCFASSFQRIYAGFKANDALNEKFKKEYDAFLATHRNDSITPFLISWSDMMDAAFQLKLSKATSTFLKTEHIFNGCPELLYYLHLLFNGLLSHGYLPYEFLQGTISPVVKDTNGDCSNPDNYRAVTLSPCLAQLLEYCLLRKFGGFLISDDLQFGFKRGHSTSHAIFTLKSCVDYFLRYKSNVFVTFLDCSKAFDKVSHYGIFLKLISRKVPLCFLNLLIYWYLNLSCCCQWNGVKSNFFKVTTGTKQGGVLSPKIFTLYVDDLISRLRRRGIGCHIILLFLACILYADDLCLVAPTRGAMQEMLHICQDFCDEFCLNFNPKKSKSLLFGQFRNTNVAPLYLNGQQIEYVDQWDYLGVTVVSGTNLSFSASSDLRSFYRSANSVLSVQRKPNELVQMKLLYSMCVPILSHTAEVKVFKYKDMHNCNVALNDAIRRIFSFNRWESPRELRQQLNLPNVYEIFSTRKTKFEESCRNSSNAVIAFLANKISLCFYAILCSLVCLLVFMERNCH